MPINHTRHLAIPGTTNFRDIGGYEATAPEGKRHTKWGLIFRTDAPNEVSAETAQVVLRDQLHIDAFFDLRKQKELDAKPYDFDRIEHVYVPSDGTLISDWKTTGKAFTPEIVFDLMLQNYRERADLYAEPYERILRHVVDVVARKELDRVVAIARGETAASDNVSSAMAINCSAGKDRTGTAIAYILHALGVPRRTIMEDFLLTNTYIIPPADVHQYLGGLGMDAASAHVLWTCHERFLQTLFDHIDERHGGMDAYLRDKLHISDSDIATMRAALLE